MGHQGEGGDHQVHQDGALETSSYTMCVLSVVTRTQASVGRRGCVCASGPQLARLRRRRTEAAHWWPLGCSARPGDSRLSQPKVGASSRLTRGGSDSLRLTLSSPASQSDSHSAMLKQ